MSHIFGSFKLFDSLKITFFIGFTAQYFVTFFIEHPVEGSSGPKLIFRGGPTIFAPPELIG